MVVFTCSACGDSVKKPQVEKHLFNKRCRGSSLCCIDCLKDFHGNEYKGHNSCITENQRYGGKNYVAKPNENKGAQKQQLWFEKVLNAIEKVKNTQSPGLQRHLEKLKNYPNVPSKKAKFEAFVKNSLGLYDNRIASQIWNIIDQNIERQTPQMNKQNGQHEAVTTKPCEDIQNTGNVKEDCVVNTDISAEQKNTEKKLSKREKKEERRKQAHKKERKDSNSDPLNGDACDLHEKKKKKKKHKDNDEIESQIGEKRKFTEIDDSVIDENGEPINGEQEAEEGGEPSDEEGEPAKKKFKTKFDWSGTIIEVLKGKDTEIKIKKLRRKVLAEYLAQGCTEKSEEKLWAKFEKKLKRTPEVKMQNDRVKLKA